MNDIDRAHLLQDLDWMFAHMGAGDESFDGWDNAYPLFINLVNRDVAGYINGTPSRSGLEHPWNARAMCLSDSRRLFCMDAKSVPPLSFSMAASKLNRLSSVLGMDRARYSFSDMLDEVVVCRIGEFEPSGKRSKFETITFGFRRNSRRWFDLSGFHKRFPSHERKFIADGLGIAIGLRVMQPTYWLADVKVEPNVPSIRILTDATGIKDLWKWRDIPQHRRRRPALLHWVSQHWRCLRTDPDVEAYVRRHLRGNRRFTHGRMQVEITPSQVDSYRNFMDAMDRSLMAKTSPRLDRRYRLTSGAVSKNA